MRYNHRKNRNKGTGLTRVLLCIAFAQLLILQAVAQTEVTAYRHGVTTDGATFFLPKTAVRVELLIEKRTYTPGRFSQYAQRFLRLNDVSNEPSTEYSIIAISQTAIGIRDTSKAFSVKFNNKTAAINVALADDGTLLAINAKPMTATAASAKQYPLTNEAGGFSAHNGQRLSPERYMTEEILAAGSTAKMAQLTAQEIYDVRDNRSQLIKGQADFMPKDGEQMKLMLSQLDEQDKALSSLFAGTVDRDTTMHVITICPLAQTKRELLFRFSKRLGLVDDDDMAGEPYYISVDNLSGNTLPAEVQAKRAKKEKKAVAGLYYNMPGKMRTTIYYGNDQIVSNEFPAAQFGTVELLSAELFNKHYGTRLWLNPVSGAIERLEAERPK